MKKAVALLVIAIFLPQQVCLAGIISDLKSGRLPSASSIKSAAQYYVYKANSNYTAATNVYNAVRATTGISARSFISPLNNLNIKTIKSTVGIATAALTRNPQAGIAVANANWTKTISNGLPGIKNSLYDKAIWARDQTIFKPGFNDTLKGKEHWQAINSYFIFITGPAGAAEGLVSSAGGLLTASVARYVPSLAIRSAPYVDDAIKVGSKSSLRSTVTNAIGAPLRDFRSLILRQGGSILAEKYTLRQAPQFVVTEIVPRAGFYGLGPGFIHTELISDSKKQAYMNIGQKYSELRLAPDKAGKDKLSLEMENQFSSASLTLLDYSLSPFDTMYGNVKGTVLNLNTFSDIDSVQRNDQYIKGAENIQGAFFNSWIQGGFGLADKHGFAGKVVGYPLAASGYGAQTVTGFGGFVWDIGYKMSKYGRKGWEENNGLMAGPAVVGGVFQGAGMGVWGMFSWVASLPEAGAYGVFSKVPNTESLANKYFYQGAIKDTAIMEVDYLGNRLGQKGWGDAWLSLVDPEGDNYKIVVDRSRGQEHTHEGLTYLFVNGLIGGNPLRSMKRVEEATGIKSGVKNKEAKSWGIDAPVINLYRGFTSKMLLPMHILMRPVASAKYLNGLRYRISDQMRFSLQDLYSLHPALKTLIVLPEGTAGTGGGLAPENIKSVSLPSSIEVNPFELPRVEAAENNNLKNALSAIKLEALNTEDLGAIGKRIAEETSNILAGKEGKDITIDNLVAREFAGLVKNRNFKIRPEQMAFTYIVAAHLAQTNLGMPAKGLTVGLEMSGGKMDGYLSGIKVASDITRRIDPQAESKTKNLYIDPDSKNLEQLKKNPTVARLANDYNVFEIENAHTPVLIGKFKPDKPQIYLMENFDAKSIGLEEKNEAKILSGVTGVIANEIQLILVDADLIKGPREGIYSKLPDRNAKDLVMKEVKLLRVITEEINKEAGLHNNGIEGITKTRSLLNGKEIRSEYQLKPTSSRKILESITVNYRDLLKDLGYDRAKEDFLNLIDLTADVLFNKEKGRHYWRTSDEKGKYVDYRIADSDGTERPNTRFGNQEEAGLIALKEGATDEQVADNLLHKPTDRITTTELLKKIGIDKAIFGSATTEGQGKTLNAMGVRTVRVTPEEKVDWNTGVNKLEVISTDMPDVAAAIKNVVELVKNKKVDQVAVTDISARKLEEVRDGILEAMDKGIIPRSEIEFVTGENRQLQGRKFEEIRQNNKVDPGKKPILLIQGMGAGVNTFNAPEGKTNKVALIKMGIDSSDKITQLSGRINKPNRAEGHFSVIVNEKQDKLITTKEKEGLSKISSPEAKKEAVLGISEKITKELDAQGVSRLRQEARKLVDVSWQQAEVTDKDIEYLQSEYLKKIKQRAGVIAQGEITTAAQLEKHLSQRGLSQPVEALKSLGLIFDGRIRGTDDELTLRGKRFLGFLADFEEQIIKGSANPYQFLKIARDQIRIKKDVFPKQLNDPDNVIADLPDRLSNLAMQEDFLNKVLEDGKDIPAPYVILNIWSLLNTPILKPQILEALEEQNIFIKSKDVENLQLTDIPQYSQLKNEEVRKIKSDLFQYLSNIESVGGIGALNNLIKKVSIKDADIVAASEDQIRIWLRAENFKNGDLNKLFNSGYGKELVLKLVKVTGGNPALLTTRLAWIINADMADLKIDFTVERAKIEFYKQAKEAGLDDGKIETIIGIIDERLVNQPAVSLFAKQLNKTAPDLAAELIIEDIKSGKLVNLENKLPYCFSKEAITQLAANNGLKAIKNIVELNAIEEGKKIIEETEEHMAQSSDNKHFSSMNLKVVAEAILNTDSPERLRVTIPKDISEDIAVYRLEHRGKAKRKDVTKALDRDMVGLVAGQTELRKDAVGAAEKTALNAHQNNAVSIAKEALKLDGGDDYFIKPTIVDENTNIEEGDSVIMFNFRGDRADPMTRLLTGDPSFKHFSISDRHLIMAPFAVYNDKYFKAHGLEGVVKESAITDTLGEVLSKNGKTQARIAESEKFKHVTWFLDGLRDITFPGMDRVLIPSNAIDMHWKKSKMKAPEITDETIKYILGTDGKEKKDVIFVNFANMDILGHFDNFDAMVEGASAVDEGIGRIREALKEAGGVLIVTADHGSGEQKVKLNEKGLPILDEHNNPVPHKAHSFDNKVPFIIEGAGNLKLKENGSLKNIAPTLLELMGIGKPAQMTADSLLVGYSGEPVKGPIVVAIRDGWGISKFNNPEALKYNAIYQAHLRAKAMNIKFNDDDLIANNPHTELWAHAGYVGHPAYQMGDSENGHLNIGAGRPVESTLSILDKMLVTGEFANSEIVRKAIDNAKKSGHKLHLIGMVSEGAVHSHIQHLFKLLQVISKEGDGINDIVLHPIFDGRDVETSETPGWEYLQQVLQKANELNLQKLIKIGVISGSYFAMDRDGLNNDKENKPSAELWLERMKPWYDATVYGQGRRLDLELINFLDANTRFFKEVGGEALLPGYLKDIWGQYETLHSKVSAPFSDKKLVLAIHSSFFKKAGAIDALNAIIKLQLSQQQHVQIILGIYGEGADKIRGLFDGNSNIITAKTAGELKSELEQEIKLSEDIVVLKPIGEKIDWEVKQVGFSEKTLSTVAVAKAMQVLLGANPEEKSYSGIILNRFKEFYGNMESQAIISSQAYENTKTKVFDGLDLPDMELTPDKNVITKNDADLISKFIDSFI